MTAENIQFESIEAKRVWASSMKSLRDNQERLRRMGIVSVMKIDRDAAYISISLSSLVKAISRQIHLSQGKYEIELKDKAVVICITK